MILAGLGDYLHDKYSKLSSSEHIQHVLVFCSVHFLRGVQQSFQKEDLKFLLRQMSELSNAQDCHDFLMSIKQKYPESTKWIDHKSTAWIISGLNVNCFKGSASSWYLASRDANAAEASHAQDNTLGRGQSILSAVIT